MTEVDMTTQGGSSGDHVQEPWPNLLQVERWARGGVGDAPGDAFRETKILVSQVIAQGDVEALGALRDRLDPAAAACDRRLADVQVAQWILQAACVGQLAAQVRVAQYDVGQSKEQKPVTEPPTTSKVCTDPDKMHGACDGFGGSDYD